MKLETYLGLSHCRFDFAFFWGSARASAMRVMITLSPKSKKLRCCVELKRHLKRLLVNYRMMTINISLKLIGMCSKRVHYKRCVNCLRSTTGYWWRWSLIDCPWHTPLVSITDITWSLIWCYFHCHTLPFVGVMPGRIRQWDSRRTDWDRCP